MKKFNKLKFLSISTIILLLYALNTTCYEISSSRKTSIENEAHNIINERPARRLSGIIFDAQKPEEQIIRVSLEKSTNLPEMSHVSELFLKLKKTFLNQKNKNLALKKAILNDYCEARFWLENGVHISKDNIMFSRQSGANHTTLWITENPAILFSITNIDMNKVFFSKKTKVDHEKIVSYKDWLRLLADYGVEAMAVQTHGGFNKGGRAAYMKVFVLNNFSTEMSKTPPSL